MSKLKQHFDELWIREVPMGRVLSAETQDQYPLRWSGAYRSKDGYIISPSLMKDDRFDLLPRPTI